MELVGRSVDLAVLVDGNGLEKIVGSLYIQLPTSSTVARFFYLYRCVHRPRRTANHPFLTVHYYIRYLHQHWILVS